MIRMDKQCFKCRETKPLSEFYTHPKMGDKLLGKCKTCTKRDVAERIKRLSNNPTWVQKERERHRKKQARYRREGTAAPSKPEYRKRWAAKNGHKLKAERLARSAYKNGKIQRPALCERCGAVVKRLEMHHEDYSKPLDVKWLCAPCHGTTRHKPFYATNP